MADIVGKKIYSNGNGKLFFGYEKEDDSVHLVDYNTWKKLTAKNLSNEFMANRLINAIVKGQKQFNKKVDYNMWSNKTKPSFEQRMDWFMKNGWISNINKGGIKESVNEIQYKDAVEKFNDELIKHPMVKKAAQHYKKTPAEIVKVLQQRLSTKGNRGGDTKEVSIDFKDTDSGITVKHKKSFNESVNEGKKRFKQQDGIGSSKYTISYHDGVKKHKDGSDFFDIKIFKNKPELEAFKKDLVSKGFVKESVNEAGEDVNKAMIPGDVKMKLQKALDSISGKKLTYPQKLQVLGRVIDSMGIDKGELNKVSQKLRTKLESVNEAKFGYTDSTASYIKKHNNEYKIAEKMNKGNEQKFYDDLQSMEDKVGHSKTMLFISNALRGYGVDMFKDPKIKNPADAQEALFLLSK